MNGRSIDIKRELEELRRRAEGVFSPRKVPAAPPAIVRLSEAVRGEETESGRGAFYRVLSDASAVWPDAAAFHREYLETLGSPSFPARESLGTLRRLKGTDPGSILYLDIETTGLGATSPLFLVGLMYSKGDRLIVDQLLARDYSEESAVLAHLSGAASAFETLVTYNGISFDVPYIRGRSTVHRIVFAPPAVHIDLLLVARSVLGRRTPNHRLQTLETHLCGRKRVGDIAGADIPAAYHEFVRTGNAADIANIVHHNRLDLVTMLQLVTKFLSSES